LPFPGIHLWRPIISLWINRKITSIKGIPVLSAGNQMVAFYHRRVFADILGVLETLKSVAEPEYNQRSD
jgi:hypothetical protein